jgi:hypothetical protein
MKVLLFVVCFCIVSTSFATEAETDCSAMSENREKIVKVATPKANTKKGSTKQ